MNKTDQNTCTRGTYIKRNKKAKCIVTIGERYYKKLGTGTIKRLEVEVGNAGGMGKRRGLQLLVG